MEEKIYFFTSFKNTFSLSTSENKRALPNWSNLLKQIDNILRRVWIKQTIVLFMLRSLPNQNWPLFSNQNCVYLLCLLMLFAKESFLIFLLLCFQCLLLNIAKVNCHPNFIKSTFSNCSTFYCFRTKLTISPTKSLDRFSNFFPKYKFQTISAFFIAQKTYFHR